MTVPLSVLLQAGSTTRIYCETCIYFNQFKEGKTDIGYCQRDSPVIIPATGSKRGHFPIMNQTDWCGEGTDKEGNRNS